MTLIKCSHLSSSHSYCFNCVLSPKQYLRQSVPTHTHLSLFKDSLSFGTFKAVPVHVDDSLSDDEYEPAPNPKHFPEEKRNFMESMLKAEKISQDTTSLIDNVRNHSLKHLSDLNETKKKEETAIALELQKKQKEIEDILRKKREEEHLKRLEFEEERIKEENEKLKLAAEEKRKREEDDERVQQEMEELMKREEAKRQQYLEEQRKLNQTTSYSANISTNMHSDQIKSIKEDEEEEWYREEERIIHLGRIEAQREYEEKRY